MLATDAVIVIINVEKKKGVLSEAMKQPKSDAP